MIIKLQPVQIPPYWESIKLAAITANEIRDENTQEYSIKLLLNLLNSNLQCLVSIDEGRNIQKITLIGIYYDDILKEKFMVIEGIYGFQKMAPEEWLKESKILYRYAQDEKCTSVRMCTNNSIVVELANRYGMAEVSRNYTVDLKGVDYGR